MPIVVTPDSDIPLPFDVTPEEAEGFRERAKAACATILELVNEGAEVQVTSTDSAIAHEIASTGTLNVAKTPPGAILKLEALLDHYDHEFLEANRKIQNLVTNKLLEETENEDAKVRLKALELLGKRKGVQLFSDQVEVTIKQKPIEEIEVELDRLLEKYMGPVQYADNGEVVEAVVIDPIKQLEIDLDKELGADPEEEAEDGQSSSSQAEEQPPAS